MKNEASSKQGEQKHAQADTWPNAVRVDNPEEYLYGLIHEGYILHGTTRQIETLVPHTANDASKESGNRHAIYMTDNPAIAMYAALHGGVNEFGWSRHSSVKTIDDTTGRITFHDLVFAAQHPEKLAAYGYVYIFPKDSADEYIQGEYLSYKPLVPEQIIEILRSDFNHPISLLDENGEIINPDLATTSTH